MDRHRTAEFPGDTVGTVKTETVPVFLGGETVAENLPEILWRDPHSGVGDLDLNEWLRLEFQVTQPNRDFLVIGGASTNRLAGIGSKSS